MVGVAQLVEHPVVVRDVAGSSPVAHPTLFNSGPFDSRGSESELFLVRVASRSSRFISGASHIRCFEYRKFLVLADAAA